MVRIVPGSIHVSGEYVQTSGVQRGVRERKPDAQEGRFSVVSAKASIVGRRRPRVPRGIVSVRKRKLAPTASAALAASRGSADGIRTCDSAGAGRSAHAKQLGSSATSRVPSAASANSKSRSMTVQVASKAYTATGGHPATRRASIASARSSRVVSPPRASVHGSRARREGSSSNASGRGHCAYPSRRSFSRIRRASTSKPRHRGSRVGAAAVSVTSSPTSESSRDPPVARRCASSGAPAATRSSQKAPVASALGTGLVPLAMSRSALSVHAEENRDLTSETSAGGAVVSSSLSLGVEAPPSAMTARRSRTSATTSGSFVVRRISTRI